MNIFVKENFVAAESLRRKKILHLTVSCNSGNKTFQKQIEIFSRCYQKLWGEVCPSLCAKHPFRAGGDAKFIKMHTLNKIFWDSAGQKYTSKVSE